MTARQRSHLSEHHFARAFILMQDQNRLCEELSSTTKKYATEVEEYKKKFNDYCSIIKRLEAKVERRMKELENLRKNPEAENLKVDVHYLVNNLDATRTWAQEKEDEIQRRLKRKKGNKLFLCTIDRTSEILTKRNRSSKTASKPGGTELLELIKCELLDINFDFFYEEGEIAALALPSEVDNNEAVAELTFSEILPTSEAVVEPTNGILPSQASAEPTSFEVEPTARTLPTQATDTTIF
ncbi:hypothetical protein Fot_41908 [Forsythia ovata]|uniref:Uncharacterized protein n=1 Tax=Forsythia ovata TaxID=205694 RepID=A0ABD1RJN6_9LAMI